MINNETTSDCIRRNDTQNFHKEISISHVNIQSLGSGEKGPTSCANVKLDQVRTIMQHREKFDIICLSETWLTNLVPDEDIDLENYTVYRKDRVGRGGGVCMYVNSSIPCTVPPELQTNEIEILWVKLQLKPKPILVGVCYRAPNMNQQQVSTFLENLQISLSKAMSHGAESVYLLGDFNDRCSEWTSKHPESELKEHLVDITTSFGLQQLICEPTYHTNTSANLLDLVFTDSPCYITDSGTLPPIGTSKHSIVYCKTKKTRICEKPYKKEIWKYHEADIEGLNIAIGDFPFADILDESNDANHAAEIWTHLVLQIAKEYIPQHSIKICPKDKPWINKDIKTCIKTRDRLFRKYQRSKREEHLDLYKKVKEEVNHKITSAKMTYKQKIVEKLQNLQNSPKRFWAVAKEVYGNKTNSGIPTLIDDNTQYSTAEQKANLLAEYFASQSQMPDRAEGHRLPNVRERNHIENIFISEEETLSVLRKLHVDKAVGPDNISNKLLKLAANSLAPSLTILFNKVVQSATYPQIWKQANVIPIYKKGNSQDKKNYRPISLLSSVGKVLEKIIFNKIYAMLEEHGLLTWRNSGYKKKDSTVNQLVHIVDRLYKSLDDKNENAMVFLDQSKAFDRIYHTGLKLKLKACGIQGALYNLLCSYLQDRTLKVAINGSKSKVCKTTAGVPQGSILGPLLFLIYINDITSELESEIHLYADDAVLMTSYKAKDTVQAFQQLNRDLARLSSWATTWFMSFNPTKTKYMVVSNNHQEQYPELKLNNTELDRVQTFPQLGVHLNEKMNWEDHINTIINRANKKIGLIWKLSNDIPRFAVENIYTSYIRPQLEYGCIIYDNCSKDQNQRLEATQRRAAIACTRAYNRTSTQGLLDELGWTTLQCRRSYYKLIQLYKMIHDQTPGYLKMLLPPKQGYFSRYPTRRDNDFLLLRCKTVKYQNSFLPSTLQLWNNLDNRLKASSSLNIFKRSLKEMYFKKKQKHYSQGRGKWAVTHTRMRLGLSPLKQQLHRNHIVESPYCPHICCREQPETTSHFFLKCIMYAASRTEMFGLLEPTLVRLGIDINNDIQVLALLLKGHEKLTMTENRELFGIVQSYISKTNRF